MSDVNGSIKFAAWMAGPAGRLLRVVAGVVLVIVGVAIGGVAGTVVGVVGLLPIAMGVSNRCLISPVIGAPWKGEDAVDLVDA